MVWFCACPSPSLEVLTSLLSRTRRETPTCECGPVCGLQNTNTAPTQTSTQRAPATSWEILFSQSNAQTKSWTALCSRAAVLLDPKPQTRRSAEGGGRLCRIRLQWSQWNQLKIREPPRRQLAHNYDWRTGLPRGQSYPMGYVQGNIWTENPLEKPRQNAQKQFT